MNTTALPIIKRATPADAEGIASALTAAFSSDPITAAWLFDNPATYHQYASGYFACYIGYCIEHGYVFTAGAGIGALLTMPLKAWLRFKDDSEFHARLEKACGPHFGRVSVLDQVMAEHHPTSSDHSYAVFLGVAPSHRGRGLGIQLIQAWCELADDQELPMYLEAGTETTARLYERYFGCSPLGQPLPLHGCNSVLKRFWRPARSAPN